eukprot:6052679-Pleurochrysis_carterae.AAC.1
MGLYVTLAEGQKFCESRPTQPTLANTPGVDSCSTPAPATAIHATPTPRTTRVTRTAYGNGSAQQRSQNPAAPRPSHSRLRSLACFPVALRLQIGEFPPPSAKNNRTNND